MHVSVFGLGKLGLCTAACFAARGHKVWGFDANPAVMAALQARQNPIRETGLDDLLAQAWPNLEFTHDINAMVSDTTGKGWVGQAPFVVGSAVCVHRR